MPTVLIVDDDPAFLESAAELLTEAGYEVYRAHDGKEAIKTLEKQRAGIALTIIDLNLPDINGFELIGALRRHNNAVKIVATTGLYKDEHLEMAATLGADAALRKPAPGNPIHKREWLQTVERLIGAPGNRGLRASRD